MSFRTYVHLVGPSPIPIFAEIEPPWRAGNGRVQALATGSIPERLHRRVEGVNCPGFVDDDENVDDWFRTEPRNRRATDVMNPPQVVTENACKSARLLL